MSVTALLRPAATLALSSARCSALTSSSVSGCHVLRPGGGGVGGVAATVVARTISYNCGAPPVAARYWQRSARYVAHGALRRLRWALKRQSCALVQLLLTQCEFLLIQRVKSSIQIFQLYSSLYEREALLDTIRRVTRLLAARGRQTVLAAAILRNVSSGSAQCDEPKLSTKTDQSEAATTAESVDSDQSQESSDNNILLAYRGEFDDFDKLRSHTIQCSQCGRRLVIDKKVAGVRYCLCGESGESTASASGATASSAVSSSSAAGAVERVQSWHGWTPFLEADNIIVWRRPHPEHAHLFAYRVYGTFSDVTADAFCEVQLNTELRSTWDDSVEQLHTLTAPPDAPLAASPQATSAQELSSHVQTDFIHWVVRFPRMFSNRDYVFERRYARDPESGGVAVVSRSVQLPEWPPQAGVVRVSDYWSVLVVRPHSHPSQPGMDFGLTYFDNPGTQLPTFVTNYVAASGLPDYMGKVASAARRVQHELASNTVSVTLQFIGSDGGAAADQVRQVTGDSSTCDTAPPTQPVTSPVNQPVTPSVSGQSRQSAVTDSHLRAVN